MSQQPLDQFAFKHGDELLRFKIGDIFASHEALDRDLLRLLCVDADLQACGELEDELDQARPNQPAHPISQAKWEMRYLFLFKLRMSFLSNALDEIIIKEHRDRPSLKALVSTMSTQVEQAYTDLRDTMRACPGTQHMASRFRNKASFHYDDGEVSDALNALRTEEGIMIRNCEIMDMHCAVAYQGLDHIPAMCLPAGSLSGDAERQNIMEEVDLIQGKLHVFTFKLFVDYVQNRQLEQKITRE